MFHQLSLHTHLLLTTLLLSHLHLTLAGSYACGSEAPNGCGWTQEAWDAVYVLRQDACGGDLTATTQDRTLNLNNGWAQLQVRIKPGYTNNHCWSVVNNIIHNCFDTNQGKMEGSGTWCSDANCNEWYWVWMNPKYRNGCWSGNRCVAFRQSGGC
jgi:hypothetical protein